MGNPETNQTPGYAKGLEGIVAGETALSFVGSEGKLYYRGIQVDDLIKGNATFEESAYLLWFGKLPTRQELTYFLTELSANREIRPEIHSFLTTFPKKCNPMAMLRSAVSCLALFDPEADDDSQEANLRKSIRLTAQFPTIIASFDRIRRGRTPILPNKDFSHAANFLFMLTKKTPKEEHAKALDQYLLLLLDHGFNASTFAARVTVSTLSDIYSGAVSAIGCLKGWLHGFANQRAMEMILDIGDVSEAENYILNLLGQKKKVMGFGHRIYKKHDPRAVIFKEIARNVCRNTEYEKYFKIAERVEEIVQREKKIPVNVDFYSAIVLYAVGIPIDLFTTIFGVSRVAGWAAHTMEQQQNNRLIRPECHYTGLLDQPYTPIDQRK
jgi:citrate synthase